MESNPGSIMIYLIIGGIALFVIIIAASDLRDEVMRAVRTRRQRRAQREYTWYARQVNRRPSRRDP